jgi:hypothetical protein
LIWNSWPTSNGQAADVVLGQSTFTGNTGNFGGISARSLSFPTDVKFVNNKFIINDFGNSRVLIFNTIPTSNYALADVVVGQPDFVTNASAVSASTLNYPIPIYSDGSKLVVGDFGNYRVLIWNQIPTANNTSADIVVGQSNFTSTATPAISSSTLPGPAGVLLTKGWLIVSDYANNRVLLWKNIPSSNGQAADYVLGQADFVSNTANAGGIGNYGNKVMFNPYFLSTFDGSEIYLGDFNNGRIVSFHLPN